MSFLQAQIAQLIQLAKKKSEEEPYYEVLEYISLDGTQYFDTEENADNTLGFECRYALTNTIPPQRWGAIKQQGTSTKYIRHHFNMSNVGNKISYDYGLDGTSASENSVTISTTFDTDIHELKLNAITKEVFFDGVSKGTYGSSADFNCEENYYLGNRSGLTGGMPVIYYVYKLFRNGVLIKDYVPVLDDKMQPCLYDKVSKTFLYAKKISDGTTAYDLGFKRWNKYDVDYLESTGTQYIDTGYKVNQNTVIKLKAKSTDTTQYNNTLTGCGSSSSAPDRVQCHLGTGSIGSEGKVIVRIDGTMSSPSTAPTVDNNWFTCKINIPDKKAYINDTEVISNFSGSYIKTIPVAIFGRMISDLSTQGYGIDAGYLAKACLTEYQFIENNVVVHNFKPSVRIYNDGTSTVTKAFLYDEVYNKAYDNAGTGSFKAYLIGYGNVFTRTGETAGKFIDADGNIQTNSNSAYSALLPIKCGETVTCVSGTASNNNYRYHVYDSSGTWIEQGLVLNPSTTEAVTGSFVAPSNASYVRVSYPSASSSNIIEVNSNYANYEVGKSVSGTPSGSISGVSNCFDTGLYGTQNTTVKHIAIGYDSNTTAGQLFGSYDGNTETSQNLTINSTGTGSTAPIRFDGQSITTAIRIPTNTFASIVTNRYGLWVNDSLHGSWGDVNDFTTSTTLLILKCNNSTNTRNNGCGYCLILEKDVPVAEYIPVRNANNTSVYGLYDKVSKTLNIGEGTINFNVLD